MLKLYPEFPVLMNGVYEAATSLPYLYAQRICGDITRMMCDEIDKNPDGAAGFRAYLERIAEAGKVVQVTHKITQRWFEEMNHYMTRKELVTSKPPGALLLGTHLMLPNDHMVRLGVFNTMPPTMKAWIATPVDPPVEKEFRLGEPIVLRYDGKDYVIDLEVGD